MLYSSADSCEIKVDSLPAGTYYIVSEGNSANGFITTNLETLVSQDSLSPTSTQPYVLSYVPTVATDDVLSLVDDEVRLTTISVTLRSRFSTAFPLWGMT